MFDLKYYKQLKQNKYLQQPVVDLAFVYEDLYLNIDKTDEQKIIETKERNHVLYTYMKKENFPDYPCIFTEHHKVKNKIDKILEINENIYIFIIINNQVEMRTKSKTSNDIKKIIYNNVVSKLFTHNKVNGNT